MITLESGQFGWDYVVKCCDTDKTILVQSDRDYPGIASTFGLSIDDSLCESDQIEIAGRFLEDIVDTGKEVEDPGYFYEEA